MAIYLTFVMRFISGQYGVTHFYDHGCACVLTHGLISCFYCPAWRGLGSLLHSHFHLCNSYMYTRRSNPHLNPPRSYVRIWSISRYLISRAFETLFNICKVVCWLWVSFTSRATSELFFALINSVKCLACWFCRSLPCFTCLCGIVIWSLSFLSQPPLCSHVHRSRHVCCDRTTGSKKVIEINTCSVLGQVAMQVFFLELWCSWAVQSSFTSQIRYNHSQER